MPVGIMPVTVHYVPKVAGNSTVTVLEAHPKKSFREDSAQSRRQVLASNKN